MRGAARGSVPVSRRGSGPRQMTNVRREWKKNGAPWLRISTLPRMHRSFSRAFSGTRKLHLYIFRLKRGKKTGTTLTLLYHSFPRTKYQFLSSPIFSIPHFYLSVWNLARGWKNKFSERARGGCVISSPTFGASSDLSGFAFAGLGSVPIEDGKKKGIFRNCSKRTTVKWFVNPSACERVSGEKKCRKNLIGLEEGK